MSKLYLENEEKEDLGITPKLLCLSGWVMMPVMESGNKNKLRSRIGEHMEFRMTVAFLRKMVSDWLFCMSVVFDSPSHGGKMTLDG